MDIKKYFSHQIKKLQKGTKKAGRKIVRVPRRVGKIPAQTYHAANVSLEQAIDRVIHRVQTEIETRAQAIAADVKRQVLKEVQQRQSGLILVVVAAVFALFGAILLCFGIVYLCSALLSLPIWLSYIIVSVIFVAISSGLFVVGRNQLNAASE